MAETKKIIQRLLKKFEEKEDYEKRKIVFWYDYDKTAKENFDEIKKELNKHDINTLVINNNYFEIKKIVEYDKREKDFLIYSTEKEKKYDKNWILDIQVYSDTFESDKIADVKSVLEIDGSYLDSFIERHYKFFKSKKRVNVLKDLQKQFWNETDFFKGILAVITKTKVIDVNKIVRNLLMNSLEEDSNEIWEKITKYNLENKFWKLVTNKYGFSSEHPNLRKLFNSFIITHIKYKSDIVLKGYQNYVNSKENDSEIFLNYWLRDSKDFNKYVKLSSGFEESKKSEIEKQLKDLDPEVLTDLECLKIFDKLIIVYIVNELIGKSENFTKYKSLISSRKNKVWYKSYENIYLALENAINLFEFVINKEIESSSLEKIYDLYKKSYYKADLFYRKFYEYFDEKSPEILKPLKKEIEKLYHNKFLDRLFNIWTKAVDHKKMKTWTIGTNPSQREFFDLFLKKYSKSNTKTAVIISDGLRYEIAQELKEKLNDLRGKIELNDLVGMLPSITKIGMASLLPQKYLKYTKKNVLCDGNKTKGLKNRIKILKEESSSNIAISYTDYIEKTREQKREMFKGKNMIYIYHDVIDATGDEAKTEDKVFKSCKIALKDIYSLVKDLTNTLSISNIFVTSDHGFIYKRENLQNIDKIDLNISMSDVIDLKKRCLVTTEDINISNTHKFKLPYSDQEVTAYVPKGPLIFKARGSGIKFVHGGIAPQEITIPVLKYKHRKTDEILKKKNIKKGYVDIDILNSSRKITTRLFKIRALQTQKIKDKLKQRKCEFYLYDDEDNQLVSDKQIKLFNSKDDKASNRTQTIDLTLKTNVENKKYYLKVFDLVEEKELHKIPFEVNLGISLDDF